MTRTRQPALLVAALALLLVAPARADVLIDQLYIVDDDLYDQGAIPSVIGAGRLLGADGDLQVVDDFFVPEPGFVISEVSFDYICFFGAGAQPFTLVEIFPDDSGRPDEDPVYSELHSATSARWFPPPLGFTGERHTVSGLSVALPPGRHWIGMQPITVTGSPWGGSGDVYYSIQDIDAPPQLTSHLRESGLDPDTGHEGSHGFGPFGGGTCMDPAQGPCTNFEPFNGLKIGREAGDSSFRILGEPGTGVADADADGVADDDDNCPVAPNGPLAGPNDQLDSDQDGIGDACECGDFSGEGTVNSIDARLVQRCAVGLFACATLCDVTGEGDCNSIDARLIQRFAVGVLDKDDLHCAERP